MRKKMFWLFLYLMILLYIATGINHFINPEFYQKIMPSYIPFHSFCIFASGISEIGFALLLIFAKTRRLAAWLIIAMLTVFFVIHIQMIIDYWLIGGKMLLIAIIRLPLQFVLIWWAHLYTKKRKLKVANS